MQHSGGVGRGGVPAVLTSGQRLAGRMDTGHKEPGTRLAVLQHSHVPLNSVLPGRCMC